MFGYLVLTRVDLSAVSRAASLVTWPVLATALALVIAELGVRAFRWRQLLAPFADVSYGRSLAYLCVGHFANTLLPARLGDVMRAQLAGASLRTSRLSVFGTILVERVCDGVLLGCSVALLLLVVPRDVTAGVQQLVSPLLFVMLVAGTAGLVLVWHGVGRGFLGRHLLRIRDRLARGADGLRSGTRLARILASTVLSLIGSTLILHLVATAIGLDLKIWESTLVIGIATLSTALPAGPASLGTYEFAGVTAMAILGLPSEPSLATIVIVHALVALPPALAGLVVSWRLHLGPLLRQGLSV